MPKKLFSERRRIVLYIGSITRIHLEKRAGGKGKVGAWIRALIEKELYRD